MNNLLYGILVIPIITNAATVSWYGFKPFEGRKTASGETFKTHELTAASNTHKLGTVLQVTNLQNNKSVIVRVNDTGGFSKYGRTLDLSYGAFNKIANPKCGIIKVNIQKLN